MTPSSAAPHSRYDFTWAALALAFLVILGMRDGFARFERDLALAMRRVSAATLVSFPR